MIRCIVLTASVFLSLLPGCALRGPQKDSPQHEERGAAKGERGQSNFDAVSAQLGELFARLGDGIEELDRKKASAKAGTDLDALSPGEPVVNLHGSVSMRGNVALGPTEVVHHGARDAVAVFYQDLFEGEPSLGWLCILDGAAGRITVVEAWDFAFSADGSKLVYAADHVVNDPTEEPPVDRSARLMAELGVTRAALESAMFEDSFAGRGYVTQPVVLDLDSGARRRLSLVGGGTLATAGGRIVAVAKPRYWSFPDSEPDAPSPPVVELDLAAGAWKPVAASVQAAALAALHDDSMREWSGDDFAEGSVLVRTRSGKLGLVVVDTDDLRVAPARF